ncbi:hypothetical protein Tco_1160139 [Tanacetum coccineum]
MKAASYPNFGLELLVPEQMWIDEVCTYDISVTYGISHWWFNRHKFYIERHNSSSHRREVRKHMRILSVVSIKAYSRYGYDYLSEIVLQRADCQEHKIAEKDFKNMYPSDFEDLNLFLLQGHLDHLPGSNKRMLSIATQLNLTKPGWDAKGFEFKHDYTIIESPRAVVVKEFKIKRLNPGINTRFWSLKDVTRSKEFMSAIERRLKMRRIYRNLECFLVDEFAILTIDFFRERNDLFIPFISQNQRDLPRDNPLVSVEFLRYDIKRSKSENKRIVPTEMELELEQTQ